MDGQIAADLSHCEYHCQQAMWGIDASQTTFFASTEAGLLQTTTPSSDNPPTPALNAANAGIIGALILHSFAGAYLYSSQLKLQEVLTHDSSAILSFLASFVLVRYKLDEAKKEEAKVEGHSPSSPLPFPNRQQSQRSQTQPDVEKSAIQGHSNSFQRIRSPSTHSAPVRSCNPRLEQVYGFTKHPPTDLMRRCHGLCIALSTVGFVLALMGTVCYAWAVQPVGVAVFSSAVMGVCLLSAAIVLIR